MVSKKFLERRGEYQEFPSKVFCLTLPGIFVGEPISVSLFFGQRQIFCFRGLRHGFLSKNFCLPEPKKFVGEPFFVSQSFWYRKKIWRRGRGVSGVYVENSLSHFAEKVRRGTH